MNWEKWDRISSLPDDILCHILSFLPTKYSVRTKILSTRWEYLFAFVPLLDFNNYILFNNNDGSRERFIEFVNKVLLKYKIFHITRFRLGFNYSSSKHLDYLISWISFAVCRNVRELDISLELSLGNASPNAYRFKKKLSLDLFSCKKLSILKLKLDGRFEIKLPNRAILPCLKTLHLRNTSFDGNILSFCPALEDLSVDCCDIGKVLDISFPILRKLQIMCCHDFELVLNAPSLVYFMYLSSFTRDVRWVSDMTSLEKAYICPYKHSRFDVRKLVTLVSHARHLCLCKFVIKAFEDSVEVLPTFHNLTYLEVDDVSMSVFKVLLEILKRCSLLEVLVFSEGYFDDFDEVDMECYKNVPSCVLVHLKEVEFQAFGMMEIEWKLVEYFLGNAKVLRKMKIQSGFCWEEEFTEKLLAFPKLSGECQIVTE